MSALLVCQAGEEIGLGHFARCLVVASALHVRLGAEANLLIQGEPLNHRELSRFMHKFIAATTALGEAVIEAVTVARPWLVLLDLHPERLPHDLPQILEALRKAGCRIVSIDGLLRYRDRVDLVFLPSIRLDKRLAQGPGARVVFGLDCILVPDRRRGEAWAPGCDVLVLTGGSDVVGLGGLWPQFLDRELPVQTKPHWVRGPYAVAPQLPSPCRLTWKIHNAPSDLQSLMASMNYAVTIFGVSFFELLKMGVPTVVFSPYGKKDDLDLRLIEADGLALVAKNERDAITKLTQLMTDRRLSSSLATRAAEALSESGGARLVGLVSHWYQEIGTKQHQTDTRSRP